MDLCDSHTILDLGDEPMLIGVSQVEVNAGSGIKAWLPMMTATATPANHNPRAERDLNCVLSSRLAKFTERHTFSFASADA